MALLRAAHAEVGGDVVSAGGTGSFDRNPVATEIQAGSYALMDTAYAKLGLPFRRALSVLATRDLRRPCATRWPTAGSRRSAWTTATPRSTARRSGSAPTSTSPSRRRRPCGWATAIRVWPAHVDPTVAYHERMHLVAGDEVLESWPIDLRGW